MPVLYIAFGEHQHTRLVTLFFGVLGYKLGRQVVIKSLYYGTPTFSFTRKVLGCQLELFCLT